MTIGDRFDGVMTGARCGQEPDVAALYQDVSPSLLRYLAAREPQEAEDLCSEVWLRLAALIPNFEGGERQWWGLVFLVARRCLNDHWKRRKRHRTDLVDVETLAQLASPVDVEATGLRAITTREAVDLVSSSLSNDQADVILLRVIAGLDIDEVAAALEKRPATVRVIQHRALRRLASTMAAPRHGDEPATRSLAPAVPFTRQQIAMADKVEGQLR
jgi:RNA polymerase sigma-70 factor (ECF subfamily)